MRYAQVRDQDISNGEGFGVSLFVQGCHFHCKNCFNQETWDFNGGKLWTEKKEEKFLQLASRPFVERVSFLGGEPLCDENVETVLSIIQKIKKRFPEKKIWVYSGHRMEEIAEHPVKKHVLEYIDVLVDGRYVDELKDFRLSFRGSSNQRILKRGEDF